MRYIMCLLMSVLMAMRMFTICKEVGLGGGKVIDSCGIRES